MDDCTKKKKKLQESTKVGKKKQEKLENNNEPKIVIASSQASKEKRAGNLAKKGALSEVTNMVVDLDSGIETYGALPTAKNSDKSRGVELDTSLPTGLGSEAVGIGVNGAAREKEAQVKGLSPQDLARGGMVDDGLHVDEMQG